MRTITLDMSDDTEEFVYSYGGETFGDYENALFYAQETHNSGDVVEIYKGKKRNLKNSDFFDVSLMIEQMQDCAFDNFKDVADGYLSDDVNKEMVDGLDRLIKDYIDTRFPKPSWNGVKNIEIITITID